MGYIKHNTIIVTYWDETQLDVAHIKAKEIFDKHFEVADGSILVSPIVGSIINGQATFMIAPDGSKEGWGDSDSGDRARKEFLDWLDEQDNYIEYVEIRFGGDDENVGIIRTNNTDYEEYEG